MRRKRCASWGLLVIGLALCFNALFQGQWGHPARAASAGPGPSSRPSGATPDIELEKPWLDYLCETPTPTLTRAGKPTDQFVGSDQWLEQYWLQKWYAAGPLAPDVLAWINLFGFVMKEMEAAGDYSKEFIDHMALSIMRLYYPHP